MHRTVFSALSLGILLTLASPLALASPQVTNYTTPGNLASTHDLGCIHASQISNQDTPADLYPAVAECLNQDKDGQAVILYVVAGAYSQYDLLRVSDKSAHDAPAIVRNQALAPLGDARMKQFSDEILIALQDDSIHLNLCKMLLKIGPPRYLPTYMTQHGMGAFTNSDADHQIKDLDPVSNWLGVMNDYTKCDVQLPPSSSQ